MEPPPTDPGPFINTTLMYPLCHQTSITAFLILSNTLSLFSHVFRSSERRRNTSVCLIDKINGEEEKNTITYEETLEKVLKRRRIRHAPATGSRLSVPPSNMNVRVPSADVLRTPQLSANAVFALIQDFPSFAENI